MTTALSTAVGEVVRAWAVTVGWVLRAPTTIVPVPRTRAVPVLPIRILATCVWASVPVPVGILAMRLDTAPSLVALALSVVLALWVVIRTAAYPWEPTVSQIVRYVWRVTHDTGEGSRPAVAYRRAWRLVAVVAMTWMATVAVVWVPGALLHVSGLSVAQARWVLLAAWEVTVWTAADVGYGYARYENDGAVIAAPAIAAPLSWALRVPEADLDGMITVDSDGRVAVQMPMAAYQRTEADVVSAVAAYLPDYMLTVWHPQESMALDPVAMHPGEKVPGVMLRASAGLILREDGAEATVTRPAPAFVWHVTSVAAPDILAAYARSRDLTIVAWEGDTVIVCTLPAHTVAIRGRIARLLRVDPWDVEVAVDWNEAEARSDRVAVLRVPDSALPMDRDARETLWKNVVSALPGSTTGWQISEDRIAGEVTLTWGPARALPRIVPLESLVEAGPTTWSRLPIGVGEDRRPVSIDLKLGPHTLVAGSTGSGKTVAITAIMVQALLRGFDLAVIDPVKRGVDFAALAPWMPGIATDMEMSVRVLQRAYDEGTRRGDVLRREGAVRWDALPADVRSAERIRPVLVVIDEAAALLISPPIPRDLRPSDPVRREAEALAAQKSRLLDLIGKIARQMRYVGIHLVVGVQRPDVGVMGAGWGEIRQNLATAIQMVTPGRPPSGDGMRMAFPTGMTASAYGVIDALDDGRTLGLAVLGGEDGRVVGARIGYAAPDQIGALLAGVPRAMRPAKPEAVAPAEFSF